MYIEHMNPNVRRHVIYVSITEDVSVNIITYNCLRYTKIWIYTISIYTNTSVLLLHLYIDICMDEFGSNWCLRHFYCFFTLPMLLFASQSSIWRLGWCMCVGIRPHSPCASPHLSVNQIHPPIRDSDSFLERATGSYIYTHVPLSIRGSYDAITQWPWQADRISTKRRAIRHDFHLSFDMVFFLYFPTSVLVDTITLLQFPS